MNRAGTYTCPAVRPGYTKSSALVDRHHAPAIGEAVDPRQRQRIDHEAQRPVGSKIERDRKYRADGAGMHHQHGVAGRPGCKPPPGPLDLADKTSATGRPVVRRRFPERAIGVAEFGDEIIVPPPGPRAKILFAEIGLVDRIEPKRPRGLARAARRAANGK